MRAEFKCIECQSELFEPGDINAKGWTAVVFTPRSSSGWQRGMKNGADIRALACRKCGRIQFYADLDRMDSMTGEGETRCRKCRHILKGLTEPRCPECGERI